MHFQCMTRWLYLGSTRLSDSCGIVLVLFSNCLGWGMGKEEERDLQVSQTVSRTRDSINDRQEKNCSLYSHPASNSYQQILHKSGIDGSPCYCNRKYTTASVQLQVYNHHSMVPSCYHSNQPHSMISAWSRAKQSLTAGRNVSTRIDEFYFLQHVFLMLPVQRSRVLKFACWTTLLPCRRIIIRVLPGIYALHCAAVIHLYSKYGTAQMSLNFEDMTTSQKPR